MKAFQLALVDESGSLFDFMFLHWLRSTPSTT